MALGYLQDALEQLAMRQGRQMTPQAQGLLQLAQQPTQTQMTLQSLMNPPQQEQPQPEMPMQMAANQADPYGGVSMQTRKAMDEMGKADPTGEFGDAIVNRAENKPANSAGYAAKTGVRGKQSPAQEEQLVKMLKGRGMSDAEARARARSF